MLHFSREFDFKGDRDTVSEIMSKEKGEDSLPQTQTKDLMRHWSGKDVRITRKRRKK